ncbi:DUF1998 domain-containing protein [Acetobacter suratthaniensis]|uniref:DUF1998 domain-containing protein n=1 Tax=Acetobacter suratthaniensis TaxID=1502841 RepID=A0ABS3LQ49_9PROT|nr:DUF1998 domain-containing protein [Acetobacter suratthaniensis]MBO1329496.1 DUF1998 domain-containing protein [Acetobacter suratthaniensis]MCX2567560.1 DUF1998 domain-containing protein [Acetobacter suratthaniensis]
MKYELRANQLIGAGGVGAIVDIGDESFVVCDTTQWGAPSQDISHPPMEQRLRRRLCPPPAATRESRGAVPLKRFPGSLFCNRPACRRIILRWDEKKHGSPDGKPKCPFCGHEGSLVPMRFVAACRNGHLSDVPWNRWISHKKDTCYSQPQLKLEVKNSGTGGLEALSIHCLGCNESRHMGSITAQDSMKQIGARCPGHHPWMWDQNASCNEELEVLQRGATNLYYPVTASALSLEAELQDETDFKAIKATGEFGLLQTMYAAVASQGNFLPPHIERMIEHVATKHNVSTDEIRELLLGGADGPTDPKTNEVTWNEAEVLAEEWSFLKSDQAAHCRREDFVCKESDLPRFRGKSPFDRVLLIERLREVRAFLGFRRIEPSALEVSPEAGGSFAGTRAWLPAVEVFGEGIFLSFDEDWVADWERRLAQYPEEVARIGALENVRSAESFWFLPAIDARRIAIHTLAHLLMRQLVFESGYSSSALRERIYSGPGMAGLLIYTADGDSEGSLGGLVRQGQPKRLADTILLALDKATWCSADPVCSETAGQGLGGFNKAACHACCLVPETSCTTANTLLDRTLLLGTGGLPGLLGDLV